MKANTSPLLPDKYYHIYNRGINGENIFTWSHHYQIFLDKYKDHVIPFVKTFAYCLLKNHFHFLIQIKSEKELINMITLKYPGKAAFLFDHFLSRQFSHLFNGYAQIFNAQMNRTGKLFESPFRRIEVEQDAYFSQLIAYIHLNPQKHRLIKDFRTYNFSSYNSHLSFQNTNLERTHVLEWFGGREEYAKFHEVQREMINKEFKYSLEEE